VNIYLSVLLHPILWTNYCVYLCTSVYLFSEVLFANSLQVCLSMPVIILNQNKVRQISYFNFIRAAQPLNAEFVWERCAHVSE